MSDKGRRIFRIVLAAAIVGVLLSQYAPLFGGDAARAAAAWSPAKKALAGNHALAFAAVGFVVAVFLERRGLSRE